MEDLDEEKHELPGENAPRVRWGKQVGIADLNEAYSKERQIRARWYVSAKDAGLKAVIANHLSAPYHSGNAKRN